MYVQWIEGLGKIFLYLLIVTEMYQFVLLVLMITLTLKV